MDLKIPVPDKDGYLFYVPPRAVWKSLSDYLKMDGHYVPEDDTPLIFRKSGDE